MPKKKETAPIILRNTLTGNFHANGHWMATKEAARRIERNSPTLAVIKHTWDMSHVEAYDTETGELVTGF